MDVHGDGVKVPLGPSSLCLPFFSKISLRTIASGDGTERFVVTGENVHLSPKATLALGIALHELGANASKFGALATGRGSILLAWRIQPTPQGERLFLRWQEKNGPVVTPPSRKGFGSQVIERGLAHELEGTVHLDYPPEGLVCTIDIPAPRVAS